MRRRIGYKTSRLLHYASFIAYLGATLHGIMAGTDTPLFGTQLMYEETAFVVVLLTAYWVIQMIQNKHTRSQNGAIALAPSPVVNRVSSR